MPRERWATIHFVKHEDKVWMFNEKGELIISELSPGGFKEISRTKLIEPTTPQLPSRRGGVCWAHPAFADRRVFARNDEEIVCASLAKSPKPMTKAEIQSIARVAFAESGLPPGKVEIREPRHRPDGTWSVLIEGIPKTPGAHCLILIDESGEVIQVIRGR